MDQGKYRRRRLRALMSPGAPRGSGYRCHMPLAETGTRRRGPRGRESGEPAACGEKGSTWASRWLGRGVGGWEGCGGREARRPGTATYWNHVLAV